MVTAPLWQFVVLTTLFSIATILVAGSLLSFRGGEKTIELKITKEHPLKTIIFSLFGCYLSFSLYMWKPCFFTVAMVSLHWSSIVLQNIKNLSLKNEVVEFRKRDVFVAAIYPTLMFLDLIYYGIYYL